MPSTPPEYWNWGAMKRYPPAGKGRTVDRARPLFDGGPPLALRRILLLSCRGRSSLDLTAWSAAAFPAPPLIRSPQRARDRKFADSLLEEAGFELSVPTLDGPQRHPPMRK